MFITFEGLDGAGKSTQIKRLTERLEQSGHRVVQTREPGGTAIGDQLRALLLDSNQKALSPGTEVLMYAASRAQLVAEVITPALKRGEIVVCDRYVDASLAYQGAGLGLGVNRVRDVNLFATGGLTPDVTFLFDITVETSQTRVQVSRGEVAPDRIEVRDANYFQTVRQTFLELAEREKSRFVVLDGEKSPELLEQEIWSMVANRISPP